jgi:ADP-ribose pyrophosphatase YjhB (NUDIX family)
MRIVIDDARMLDDRARRVTREAVKAVAVDDGRVLLLESRELGDFRFPGGGVEIGETHTEALARELDEDCGMVLRSLGELYLDVVERRVAFEARGLVFEMTSHYYWCDVAAGSGKPAHDPYERELSLTPGWVEPSGALHANRNVLTSLEPPAWTRRETLVLQHLLDDLMPR